MSESKKEVGRVRQEIVTAAGVPEPSWEEIDSLLEEWATWRELQARLEGENETPEDTR